MIRMQTVAKLREHLVPSNSTVMVTVDSVEVTHDFVARQLPIVIRVEHFKRRMSS